MEKTDLVIGSSQPGSNPNESRCFCNIRSHDHCQQQRHWSLLTLMVPTMTADHPPRVKLVLESREYTRHFILFYVIIMHMYHARHISYVTRLSRSSSFKY